ncbi:hypothetical protein OFC53_30140, partial [Escherichia coli]|nr:hypothetical protein [Escherichia coli]
FGLKPGWIDLRSAEAGSVPQANKVISVAYQKKHPMFPVVATAIKTLLKPHGIEVEFIRYDSQPPAPEEVDIWVKAMGIATNRNDALAGWLLD